MSLERRRLQPWFTKEMNLHGFLSWKLEDKNRPGLPDCITRSPLGRTCWVELKWSRHKTTVAVHLSPTQFQHMKEWTAFGQPTVSQSSCWVVVAAPAFDRIYLIPFQVLKSARETFKAPDLDRLLGVESCACSRADLGPLLRRLLA